MDDGAEYFLKLLLASSTQYVIQIGLTPFYVWTALPKKSVMESKQGYSGNSS